MIVEFIKTFVFGIVLAISIGPIAIIIFNNAINHGIASALYSALGAAFADFLFAIFAFTIGFYLTIILEAHQQLIHLVSAIILTGFGLWMSYGALKSLRYTQKFKTILPMKAYGLKTTFLLTLINPLSIIAFTAFSGQITYNNNILFAFLLAFFLFLGSLLTQFILAGSASLLQSFFKKPLYVNILNVISGVAITIFGVLGIIHLS